MKHQSDTYYSKEANTSQHKYPGQVWTKRWWVTCKENLQFVRWSIRFASCSLHFLKWLNPQLYVKEKLVLLIFHRTFHLEHNSIIKHCTHNKASFYFSKWCQDTKLQMHMHLQLSHLRIPMAINASCVTVLETIYISKLVHRLRFTKFYEKNSKGKVWLDYTGLKQKWRAERILMGSSSSRNHTYCTASDSGWLWQHTPHQAFLPVQIKRIY